VKTYPAYIDTNNTSQKDWWLSCYLAALSRVGPDEAKAEADSALAICNERWKLPPVIGTWQYEHNYPVGHEFKPSTSDEARRAQDR
jgi:hypothetical protein